MRALATQWNLPTAKRKDSQGLCFLGKVRFSEFIKEHLGEKEGDIVELETGTLLGKHRGFWFHTVGQRKGLGLPGGPWYVAAKDAINNVVYASRNYYDPSQKRRWFDVGELSWTSDSVPKELQDVASGGEKVIKYE